MLACHASTSDSNNQKFVKTFPGRVREGPEGVLFADVLPIFAECSAGIASIT
jgi:hypothetical protein